MPDAKAYFKNAKAILHNACLDNYDGKATGREQLENIIDCKTHPDFFLSIKNMCVCVCVCVWGSFKNKEIYHITMDINPMC